MKWLYIVGVGLGISGYAFAAPPTKVQTIAERFSDAPFAILIDAPPVALKAGGTLGISAKICGACHPNHAQDWARSTHAHAVSDPQFIAELSKPDNPRWLCLNCHIPLQQQRAYRVDAQTQVKASRWNINQIIKKENPSYNKVLVEESITCATCHVRRDTDGLGVIIGPRGSPAAPHRVRTDPKALHNICVRCHDAGPIELTGTFTCWFETAREIAAGPQKGSECVSCHMPMTEGSVAIGQPVKAHRSHWWRGGGPGKTFESPLGPSALEVMVVPTPGAFEISLKNTHSAHTAPTADPERHFRVIVEQGETRSVQSIRQQWDWGDVATLRPAKRIADTRIRAGETQVIKVPRSKGRATIRVLHVRLTIGNIAHMRRAVLDDELQQLAPKARELLPKMTQEYPLFRTIYKAEFDGQSLKVIPKPEAGDQAMKGWTDAQFLRAMGE